MILSCIRLRCIISLSGIFLGTRLDILRGIALPLLSVALSIALHLLSLRRLRIVLSCRLCLLLVNCCSQNRSSLFTHLGLYCRPALGICHHNRLSSSLYACSLALGGIFLSILVDRSGISARSRLFGLLLLRCSSRLSCP